MLNSVTDMVETSCTYPANFNTVNNTVSNTAGRCLLSTKDRPGSRFSPCPGQKLAGTGNPGPGQNPEFWPGSNWDFCSNFVSFFYLFLLNCWENLRTNE